MSETKHISLKNLQAFLKPLMRMINRKAESWEDLKNKPFGSEYKQIDLISNVSRTVDNDYGYERISNTVYFNAGQTYTVIYDGVQYECVAWRMDSDCVCIGNGDIYGGSGMGNGEPFMCDSYRDGACYVNVQFAGTHTISISTINEVITKLPDKYLPETITYDNLVGKTAVEYVEQELTDEQKYIARVNIEAVHGSQVEKALEGKLELTELKFDNRTLYEIIECGNILIARVVKHSTPVKYDDHYVGISRDGYKWEFVDTGLDWIVDHACYGNDTYLLIDEKSVSYSTDGGYGWTAVKNVIPLNSVVDICYGNGKFIVVGRQTSEYPALAYSTDGITWTPVTLPVARTLTGICYGYDKFIAMAEEGYLIYSSDGVTWTEINVGKSRKVCYGHNGIYVSIPNNIGGYIEYSMDGISWVRVNQYVSGMRDICYGDKFVAIGSDMSICSEDGITWTVSYLLPDVHKYASSICAFKDMYIVTEGSSSYLISYDGIHWTNCVFKQNFYDDEWYVKNALRAYVMPELSSYATQEYVQDASAQIEARIGEHNINNTAHTDIRESINELSILVGDESVATQIEKAMTVATEEQLIALLMDIDAFPAMTDKNGAVFTDKSGAILLV